MMKTYLTAALLVACMAIPAAAQQSGGMGGSAGGEMGGDTSSGSGDMSTGGATGSDQSGTTTQESQVPGEQTPGEEQSPTIETEIPITSSTSAPAVIETPDQPSETEVPADQSGASETEMPSETEIPSDQGGALPETQEPADQSDQSMP